MLLFVWLVLLAGSLGVREDFHVRLTVVTDRLPPLFSKILAGLITVTITAFGGVLLLSGQSLIVRTAGHVSATIRYPIEMLYYPVPICGGLIMLHGLAHLFRAKRERSSSD